MLVVLTKTVITKLKLVVRCEEASGMDVAVVEERDVTDAGL